MSLRTIETFDLGETKNGGSDDTRVVLNIVQGSVIGFEAPSSEIASNTSKDVPKEEKPDAQTDSKKDETKPADEVSKQNSEARVGAIVNAANERCLGGGGVDGAISNAGGYKLFKDREALPILSEHEVRCHTGSAVITGPNRYGSLRVNYVVHAVGPAYFLFSDAMSDEDSTEDATDTKRDESDEFAESDALLRSAYQESLERCRENGITDVAFSLLSAGIFRGKRSLNDVLFIGVTAIRDWVDEQHKMDLEAKTNDSTGDEPSQPRHRLRSVTLCGFSVTEVVELVKVCRHVFRNKDSSKERTCPGHPKC